MVFGFGVVNVILFHGSIRVPKYSENCSEIKLEKLSVMPTYLDEIKDKIDEHANIMRMPGFGEI